MSAAASRELHDSTGQMLAALNMNLTPLLQSASTDPRSKRAVEESLDIVHDLSKEVRTLSHLLHPPPLDEVGLASALRLYIDGFAERSQIEVTLDVPEDFGRLPRELETAIFRIVQECLTNIHRHSRSPVARIALVRSGDGVRLELRDEGQGIAPERLAQLERNGTGGVGIRGMRERVRQLGGRLDIVNAKSGSGTVVIAWLPAEKASSDMST